ncbi:hypothetical protein CYY_000115 [Polysphondylium violaceum]|uniref:Cytochrome P450 family protein n=1 Tax=Polysphondylium violaceum TaxID=133409 RepID=A0A8J4V2Q3_9MYCE|nr:hypothetical protein CYY_000115 [Polysphondylium violaceum]
MLYIILLLFIAYLGFSFISKNFIGKTHIPGPLAFPIIGNLNLFNSPHLVFHKLAEKFRTPCIRLWMGDHYVIVVNDFELFKGIYLKNANNFKNRPLSPGFQMISGNFRNIIHAPTPTWTENKDLVKNHFTNKNIFNVMPSKFDKHINSFIDILENLEKTGEKFDVNYYIIRIYMNLVMSHFCCAEIAWGDESKKLVDELCVAVDKAVEVASYGSYRESLSILSPIYKYLLPTEPCPLQPSLDYLKVKLQEHKDTFDPNNIRDVMDGLIRDLDEKEHDRIIYIGTDFFLAGAEGQIASGEWFFVYLSSRPEIQDRAYQELKSVFGDSKRVDYMKKNQTPYFNAIIKEVLRIQTPLPLSIPRVAEEDITINGTFIPKHSCVIPNLYSIHRQERYWKDPNEFIPERFMVENETSLPYIPYGLGERGCIGLNLAQNCVYTVLGSVLLNFSFTSDKVFSYETKPNLVIHPNDRDIQLNLKKR